MLPTAPRISAITSRKKVRPPFQVAAIAVGPAIAQLVEELRRQIAMAGDDLDTVEAGPRP